jgi:hypothetical protein
MKTILDSSSTQISILILNILILIYPKVSNTVWSSPSLPYDQVPFFYNISYLLFSILISCVSIFFFIKNIRKGGKIFTMVFLLGIVSLGYLYKPLKTDLDSELDNCVGLDKTGGYMDLVVSRIKDTGCGIQTYFFTGNGIYIVQAVCVQFGGSKEFQVVVNNCGEILSVK